MPTLGLDIGGANLKAAHPDGTARAVPFALWKQPERLPEELARLCRTMPAHDRLAVTMTGELCDCFESKRDGVGAILRDVARCAGGTPVYVWTTRNRFLDLADALADPLCVAAANWLALARLVAERFATEHAVLIDTGSTTTDIVYLERGVPTPRGWTDPERLAAGELVYTGVRRTPICSVLGMTVAAELFATMLDAYVMAGLSPEDADDRDTADGRPATRGAAHARLARMVCADAETCSAKEAAALAQRALQAQWQAVRAALDRVLAGSPAAARVVLAGSGEILGRQVAASHPALATARLTSLAETLGLALSASACAYAVAVLAEREVAHAR